MNKRNLIVGGLILVIVILCMMSIYLQRQSENLLIQCNRMDRELAMMRKDYEKLYSAYYSYEKKILKILEGNEQVYWDADSAAYAVKTRRGFIFSFYKKPKMYEECYVWWFRQKSTKSGYVLPVYIKAERVDTLKPHQCIVLQPTEHEMMSLSVGSKNMGDPNKIKINELVCIFLTYH